MSSPLSFLRPLRYDRVREVLLVQTGAGVDLPGIVARVREIFPGCTIQVLVREADSALGAALEVERFEVARWEERFDLLSRLRRRRFDVVVLQLGATVGSELRLLPFLVRTRYLIAFNHALDYFPINVFRLTALAHHFSLVQGEGGGMRSLYWLVRGAVLAAVLRVASLTYLAVAVGRIHVRGWWRRRRRGRGTVAAAGADARLA